MLTAKAVEALLYSAFKLRDRVPRYALEADVTYTVTLPYPCPHFRSRLLKKTLGIPQINPLYIGASFLLSRIFQFSHFRPRKQQQCPTLLSLLQFSLFYFILFYFILFYFILFYFILDKTSYLAMKYAEGGLSKNRNFGMESDKRLLAISADSHRVRSRTGS